MFVEPSVSVLGYMGVKRFLSLNFNWEHIIISPPLAHHLKAMDYFITNMTSLPYFAVAWLQRSGVWISVLAVNGVWSYGLSLGVVVLTWFVRWSGKVLKWPDIRIINVLDTLTSELPIVLVGASLCIFYFRPLLVQWLPGRRPIVAHCKGVPTEFSNEHIIWNLILTGMVGSSARGSLQRHRKERQAHFISELATL